MLDGKNSLSKKKENDIPRRIYLAQLVLFIRKGRVSRDNIRWIVLEIYSKHGGI